MNHHSLFNDKSDLYERARPTYPRTVFDFLRTLCSDNHTVWDCACGSGQAAIDLARYFTRVYASDISEEQISNAKTHSKVHYSVGAAEHTEFPDNTFDMVCVAQALHWFDHSLFWPQVKRVLKPGGIFATLGYNLPTIDASIDAIIRDNILSTIEPFWDERNQLIWDHYSAINFPFDRVDSPAFTMTTHWTLTELFSFIHTFSATRRCMDEIGDDFFHNAYEAASDSWGTPSSAKAINFDFVFYAGVNND